MTGKPFDRFRVGSPLTLYPPPQRGRGEDEEVETKHEFIKGRIRFLSLLFWLLFFLTLPPGGEGRAGGGEENLALSEGEKMHLARETDLKNRVQEVERQVAWLGEEIRFLKEQTRNLDRRVDDLRNRHV